MKELLKKHSLFGIAADLFRKGFVLRKVFFSLEIWLERLSLANSSAKKGKRSLIDL
jgi:hypothetical protein